MKKLFFIICFLFGLNSIFVYGQTSAQQLEKAVLLYEEFKEYTSSDALDIELAEQDFIYEEAIDLLKIVQKDGTVEEFKAAKYFETILTFEYGVSALFVKDYDLALEYFQKIELKVMAYNSNDFPIRYARNNTSYVIEWSNFKNTQSEMYSMLVETCFNLYKQDELIEYFNKYKSTTSRTDYLDYVTHNLLLESIDPTGLFSELLKSIQNLTNDEPIFTDLEMTEYALFALKSYDKLPTETKNELLKNKVNTTEQGLKSLLKYTESSNTKSISNLAEGVYIVCKNNPNQKDILKAIDICLSNFSNVKLNTNEVDFLRTMINEAKINNDLSKDTSKIVGIKANNLLAKHSNSSNCDFLSEIASNYFFWHETALGNEYTLKSNVCKEEQNKIARKNARASKRANANTNIYAGVYVLPLINYNDKRDYGGVLNITNHNLSYEFSFLKINQKKENIFDLWINEVDGTSQKDFSLWNGYYSHFQLKIHEDEEAPYVGILAGYANKNFEPFKVAVQNNQTLMQTAETFDPSVKQFIGMVNFGIMQLRKGLGIDAYFGFGFNYSKYSNGTTIDRTLNTIQNPSLQNRKDSYFGYIMRFGLTFGLNFGRGN